MSRFKLAMVILVVFGMFVGNAAADDSFDQGKLSLPAISQGGQFGALEAESAFAVTPSGSAPPLTYLEVYAVGSSQYGGYEYISQYQTTTAYDHGGTTLIVVTIELGYGGTPVATMAGGQLPLSANYRSDALCWDYYGNLVYCSPGQTVAGWMKYWDVSGYQNGYFTYQNTSINSPWNTMSDAISIQ